MALGRSLFRQEAVEFQRAQRDFGEIALLQPVSTKLLTWLLLGIVTIALVFLCFAQFSSKQVVPGYLAPAAGTLKIFPQREGVVISLQVNEGQQVKSGDPLFTVATPQIAADGEDTNAAKLTTLRQQKEALLRQMAVEQRSAVEDRDRLTALTASSQTEIGAIRGQIDLEEQRVRLAEGLVTTAKELLEKGYMSTVESRRREDSLLEHKQNIASLRRQLAEKQGKLAEAQYSLKQLSALTARKIQPLRDQVADIDQRIAEGKAHSSYVVRAPAAGRISMLQVAVGQMVQPQRLQLEIVPDDSPLQAELLIPTRAARFVRNGQQVRLLYDAFPYQNFGAFTGHIASVSRTVLTKADAAGPLAPEEPVYKATAALDRPDVDANGRKAPLQAGMLLKAEIVQDRRPLARWILDPLLHKRM